MTTEVAEQKRRSDGFLGCEGGRFSSLGCSAASGKKLKSGGGGCGGDAAAPTNGGGGSACVKERKDRIGKRVAALQQLVSPFGKTDTASVLQETADYINFLHAQLQVLSSPYLRRTEMEGAQQARTRTAESDRRSLRARGLCLVPLPCALRLARSNGADIWAPNMTNSRDG